MNGSTSRLPKHDIVLLGIGHTNAHVLRMWRMSPIADARLTCVSNFPIANYSGMLPGVLSGQYPKERMEIDLVRLCAASGARFIQGHVSGLDVENRQVLFDDRPPLPFDVLSIGIGSVPSLDGVEATDETLMAIKPMQTFPDRLNSRLSTIAATKTNEPLRITIVGGGIGSVEIAFCLPNALKTVLPNVSFEITLVCSGETLVGGMQPKTQARVLERLEQRGVQLRLGRLAKRVANGVVILDGGDQFETDLVLWATNATAPSLLGRLNLPTEERGFLLTRPTLQTVADAPIFVVGDSGTIQSLPLPKAGVYAVRQGPFLWRNIQRLVQNESLEPFVPQKDFLKLINTGDGRAIAEYRGMTLEGRWCWKWKDYIDSRFMDMYQDYQPMPMVQSMGDDEQSMRCVGCGGKVGGSVLSRVLERLDVPASEHVLLGLDEPDDAAIIQSPKGRPLTVTTDFFAAPFDDPYLVGRIAMLNAASDVFALGAQPLAALTIASIPFGRPRHQEQVLFEVLAGGLEELRRMGATLVGGHTIEGPRLTIGYTLLADQMAKPQTKSRLRPGDCLILTKPLGTGILLVAHAQAMCRGAWMPELLTSMLLSNQPAAALSDEFDICGITDVTGFGLAGHMLEMLRASRVSARIELDSLPLLAGVAELVPQGIESTLAPDNRDVEVDIAIDVGRRSSAEYVALFDPQTSGGMLMGVRENDVDQILNQLSSQSNVASAVIGRIEEFDATQPRITIT